MTKQTKATIIGFCAILLWSSIVGLIKEVTQSFGPTGGAALIYTGGAFLLLFSVGWVPLRNFSRAYLIWGGVLMVSYELCLALSIGYSTNSKQAIEVGMVNYLWPTLTMVATIIFHTKKANWMIVPGVMLSAAGIVWVLAGDEGLDVKGMFNNLKTNPLSYGLAFFGAFLWAAYCVLTIRISNGINGITLFFMLVAIVLWGKYLLTGEQAVMDFNISSVAYLILAAIAMGFGYAAWNIGIISGNVTVLTGASYFIPVLSSALSSVLLSTTLGFSFWKGSLMVCIGSVLCWLSSGTTTGKPRKSNRK